MCCMVVSQYKDEQHSSLRNSSQKLLLYKRQSNNFGCFCQVISINIVT